MVWKPDVTVAAVIERDGRFLMIEEHINTRLVINQPAGHLEKNETLIEAVIRETLEETAWDFIPEALCGIYLLPQPERGLSYLRIAFIGKVTQHYHDRPLDHGIRRTLWLSREELLRREAQLRSPLVLRCIDDYVAGQRFPLSLLVDVSAAPMPVSATN